MNSNNSSNLVLYSAKDGQPNIQLRVEVVTVWLSQMEIVELFATNMQNVGLDIQNIFEESQLLESATVKESLTVQFDGNRKAKRGNLLYNLGMILAIAYRMKSSGDTQFRQCATANLSEYLVKSLRHE